MAQDITIPCIVRAEGDRLFDESGREYIDLFNGHGTTFLGHSNSAIIAALQDQTNKVWITGGLDSPPRRELTAMLDGLLEGSHRTAGICSTGMEAAELALRIARIYTRNLGVIGFDQSMHGKSLATAALGWENPVAPPPQGFFRLQFPRMDGEDEIVSTLERRLAKVSTAAVFVEPIQGCAGGRVASDDFYRRVYESCQRHGTLLVFDELLTGLHRLGRPFFFSELGFTPDMVLIGKTLGNGFPIAALLVHQKIRVQTQMLPGSTFAGNPLACVTACAVLRELQSREIPELVRQIESIVQTKLEPLHSLGLGIRGQGALWMLEFPADFDLTSIVVKIYEQGVCIGCTNSQIRLLPAATIDPQRLQRAMDVIVEVIAEGMNG